MKRMLIVILVVLFVLFTGCETAPSLYPTPPEMVGLKSPLYIIEGANQVEGFRDFFKKMGLIYGDENVGILGGYPLVEGIEEYLESIRKTNSILIIPPTPDGIQEFRDLENKYPDLCPIFSTELELELESYSSPLLYFSQDLQAEILRGIIVANQVDTLLAELLTEKELPLDVSFREEDGQWQILE